MVCASIKARLPVELTLVVFQNLSSQLLSSLVIPLSKYGSNTTLASVFKTFTSYEIAPTASISILKNRFTTTSISILLDVTA